MGKASPNLRELSASVSPCTDNEEKADKTAAGKQKAAKAKAKAASAEATTSQPPRKVARVQEGSPIPASPPAGLPAGAGGTAGQDAQAQEQSSAMLRQALTALKQRRVELETIQAALESQKSENRQLSDQLKTAKQELDSTKEEQASSIVVYQSKISSMQAELETAHKTKSESMQEAESLRSEVRTARADLEASQKSKTVALEEQKALRLELEDARRIKLELLAEKEALKSQVTDAQKQRDKANEEAKAQRDATEGKLKEMQVSVQDAYRVKGSLIKEVESLRAQLTESRTQSQEAQERIALLEHSAEGSGGLEMPAKVHLEAAWEALVCTGLEQMRSALASAGVRTRALSSLRPSGGSSSSTAPNGGSSGGASASSSRGPAPDGRLKRKGSKESLGQLNDQDIPGPSERRSDGRKEKKKKKDRRSKKEDSDSADDDMDLDIGEHAVLRSSQGSATLTTTTTTTATLSSSASSGAASAAASAMASRRIAAAAAAAAGSRKKRKPAPAVEAADSDSDRAGGPTFVEPPPAPSALRKRTVGRGVRISFVDRKRESGRRRPLTSQTAISSCRPYLQELWFSNPEAHVMCDMCKRRVPQRMGQLRGGTGTSSFMCNEFYCIDCSVLAGDI